MSHSPTERATLALCAVGDSAATLCCDADKSPQAALRGVSVASLVCGDAQVKRRSEVIDPRPIKGYGLSQVAPWRFATLRGAESYVAPQSGTDELPVSKPAEH